MVTTSLPSIPVLDNLTSNEVIYQRFVLVKGHILGLERNTYASPYIAVQTVSFPRQTFPVSPENGKFIALVHLQPGPQSVTFSFNDDGGATMTIDNISYIPLLHVPPLHLALLVARDSDQRMDCPPEKSASPTHSDVEAAKKKMRLWAYMCQAFTAEEMRMNGLGRRSFRLDETWAPDTLSVADKYQTFRATATVHVVPTALTMADIRDPDVAQQNPKAHRQDQLYNWFHDALAEYGGPFKVHRDMKDGPVIAGHIVDSHYDAKQDLILGHAALGGTGGLNGLVHLGMFGSHTHWAWPRFVEELAPCLLDATRVTGWSDVGNDNGECGTFWEACCIGQGAALHEVGHAFGLPHQPSGIMLRGYVDWNRSFVTKESYNARRNSPAAGKVPEKHENHWCLADILHFANHPMFALPLDPPRLSTERATIAISATADSVTFISSAGIAHVCWTKQGRILREQDLRSQHLGSLILNFSDVRAEFGNAEMDKPLVLTVTACDGTLKILSDFWDAVGESSVLISDCNFYAKKHGIVSGSSEGHYGVWKWAVLLSKLGADGKLVHAKRMEVRAGTWLDGCYVMYEDGSRETMGPKTYPDGRTKHLGGSPTYVDINVSAGECITHVVVLKSPRANTFRLGNVKLFTDCSRTQSGEHWQELRPKEGQVLIGFYGKNIHDHDLCETIEFGILTVPEGAVLPAEAYILPQLTNMNGGASTTK
ncbi:putative peptidase family-domain-containing protein [Vararia minispora EC-137]|uniref:Peptidase family-domain-containing protein n=1 Tax=Vararia minispora EC-137 TaxID=1314806 RepID=A0ACB8QKG8_9AGAM|nr:putative peptidase family-domain-containing protein [Vararia minispora EC-137]